MEREFYERNRAAYAELSGRGLLPPEGDNVFSQEINEYLLRGGSSTDVSGPDATPTDTRADGVRRGNGWDDLLREELEEPYWSDLLEYVTEERADHDVYPPWEDTFKAFELTPFDGVKAVILGQDPYINPGQAHGLAFSVPVGAEVAPAAPRLAVCSPLRRRAPDGAIAGVDPTMWPSLEPLLVWQDAAAPAAAQAAREMGYRY